MPPSTGTTAPCTNDAAGVPDRLGDHVGVRLLGPDVAGHRHGAVAVVEPLQPLGLDVDADDRLAGVEQQLGGRPPDARSGAGDNRRHARGALSSARTASRAAWTSGSPPVMTSV